jgi:hypothetical protein
MRCRPTAAFCEESPAMYIEQVVLTVKQSRFQKPLGRSLVLQTVGR